MPGFRYGFKEASKRGEIDQLAECRVRSTNQARSGQRQTRGGGTATPCLGLRNPPFVCPYLRRGGNAVEAESALDNWGEG